MAQTRALREFLAAEVAGAIVLLVAAVVAIVWANSPWKAGYNQLWNAELSIAVGHWDLSMSLRDWVNEGLMSAFFLVVGLEVKREFVQGELRDPRRAALPIIAAIGGMIVPGLLYAAFNAGGAGSDGWAIPMATDVAFALGVLALVSPGLPSSLRVFLLALAIVDDIGAIVVIALFYSGALELQWLAAAVAIIGIVYLFQQFGLTFTPLFVALGVLLWLALHGAGVHATIAGVAMGLLAPAAPKLDREVIDTQRAELLDVSGAEAARTTSQLARHAVSRVEWLEHALHPWTSWIVVPIFALANAGVTLSGTALRDSLTSPVTLGVIVGLVTGKAIGITGASWIACQLGIAALPTESTWRDLIGLAVLAGIGFTVSLLITDFAFGTESLGDEARVGIFAASIVAAVLAAIVLRAGHQRPAAGAV
ncbi:MAG TPA: Na+/H+ antiporter NhaA [Acidimicrobiales bacterium]|nr:Na+/H+ antiporter NhaA [Acidimicrobiales bacterium]